ncbi:uncharacterized protein [Macrobrachium rosenbergii]|uniref:uncharacterized protein n=1 Tax=Macrobrachium rosenbergii TaxID=79674 RepID=UPI0034D4BAED
MEEQIASCAALWSTEYEKTVIAVLKRGKTGQTLKREYYHILQTFQIASFGEIETVKKKNGKYMATKESVTGIIQQAHINTGHVNGRPRHPQSQGSIERGNGDMKLKLMEWIRDNNCAKWSYGVRFVQWAMNSSYHEAIKMTSYQALTGNKPRCGLKSNLPDAFISKILSGIEEEQLERLIEVPLTGDSARDDLISVDPECEREPHPVADSQQQPAMEQENISTEVLHPAKQARKEAEYGLQKQAQRMLARSTRSMRAVDVGDNVSVPVSQFDRSKGDPPNIVGVVLAVEDSGYVIGTKSGIINGKLARNQFDFVQYKGLLPENILKQQLSIRELVRAGSVCGGQGYQRCLCRSNCLSKRRSCLKASLRCNSACHSHKSCDNNDK